jgi:hypothetical protein
MVKIVNRLGVKYVTVILKVATEEVPTARMKNI